ncbi:hypothetical protein CsatB_014103 [Cannabis sativa]
MASTLSLSKALLLLSTLIFLFLLPFLSQNNITQNKVIIHTLSSPFNNNNTTSTITPIPPLITYHHISNTNDTIPPDKTIIKKKKSRLERIEYDLVKARVAIRQAITSKSFKSDKNESIIPRGSIYRNPYAFHQSHIEMVKRFKVWSYKEGERPIYHMGPMNNIYAIEGQFMEEIESEESPFRAKHPEEAHTFFMPISVANIIKFIYSPVIYPDDYKRDRLCRVMNDYVGVVANKYPFWNTSHGADHFMLSCHDWGPQVSYEKQPQLFKHFMRVLCNANISEGFEPKRDVSLPEIYLSHGTLGPPNLGRAPHRRTKLAFFAGGPHGYIREILFQQWKDKDSDIQVFEKVPKELNYTELMGKAKYCLCPSGYEVASPRVVEAINAGCVPVIISDSYSLPFSDVLDWSQFTIQISISKIPEIKNILNGIPNEKYLRLYNKVSQVKKHFVLNRPAQPFDVIHMVLHSIWLRRLNFKIGSQNSL